MKSEQNPWTKSELKTYILLLCANADSTRSNEEIEIIKAKTDIETFNKIYTEFKKDSEDESLQKIDDNVQLHEFSYNELEKIREEMEEIFKSDKDYGMTERNLYRILDNILY